MANGRPITNDRLYDTLNSMRLELKADIGDLRKQFENLESGRITRLENKMNDFEVTQTQRDSSMKETTSSISTRLFIIWSIIGSVSVAFLTALAYKLVVKGG